MRASYENTSFAYEFNSCTHMCSVEQLAAASTPMTTLTTEQTGISTASMEEQLGAPQAHARALYVLGTPVKAARPVRIERFVIILGNRNWL